MDGHIHTTPGNEYRQIAALPVTRNPSLSVVMPVHNRVDLLERTLAGLVAQTVPADAFDVLIVDDGSTQDIDAAAAAFADHLRVRVQRQEKVSYGAARARNRGAEIATGDVLFFLDSDCIPTPGTIARHLWWHHRAANVAVIGARTDVDSGPLDTADVRAGDVDLWAFAGADPSDPPAPQGWRRLFYRRTRRLLLGATGFRAGMTANLSIPAAAFAAVGAFDEGFEIEGGWGGEDTELAWRLWNDGTFFVPEDRALALHQVQHDAQTDRRAGRAVTLPRVRDRVAVPFYRKEPSHLATVPRVTWVIHVDDEDDPATGLELAARSTFADSDVVLWGSSDRLGPFQQALADNPRVTVVDGKEDAAAVAAIHAARGELLACTSTAQQPPPGCLARAVERLDDRDAVVVRFPYRVDTDRYLRLDDLTALDLELGPAGLPLFAVLRRRELVKHLHATADPRSSWRALAANNGQTELITGGDIRVSLPAQAPTPRPPGVRELQAIGPRKLARSAAMRIRNRLQTPGDDDPTPPDDRVGVEYIGWLGNDNLGDDAMHVAIQRLMPWANIGQNVPGSRMVMIGGGTLLNVRKYYLIRMQRQDAPYMERCLFGTGVRSPAFWGETEPMQDWFSFIESSLVAGVRGPDSVAHLRGLGYGGPIEMLGDPALNLRAPEGVRRREGHVVICPVWTSGELHGDSDAEVFDALATQIRRLHHDGHEVTLMSAFPGDDRWLLELMRNADLPELPYVAGYDDVDASLALLASADLVIGERLHAVILAAAVGTPFVALEYRPKVADFTRSVGQEDVTLRTDEMDRLGEVVREALRDADARRATMSAHVGEFRVRQEAAAERLRRELTGTE